MIKCTGAKQHNSGGVTLSRRADTGFTLLELMFVIAIMALGAAAAVPAISSSNHARLDLVAAKVATALRFTRSEAIRTGIAHGVIVDHDDSEATGKDIVVYRLDISGTPFDIDQVVYQPITRQPYDIFLVDASEGPSIAFRNSTPVFTFATKGPSQHLHFDPTGRPAYYVNGVAHRLLSGSIRIGKDAYSPTVTISPLTGQVTVQ